MFTQSAKLTFHIPSANSLKDKRQIRRRLVDRARNKFNAAIAEVGQQDAHRTLVIGIAVVSGSSAHAREMLDEIIRYMDTDEAELTDVEYQ